MNLWCDDDDCELGETIVERGEVIEGRYTGDLRGPCPSCNRDGLDPDRWARAHGIDIDEDPCPPCPACRGVGQAGDYYCPTCHATGIDQGGV